MKRIIIQNASFLIRSISGTTTDLEQILAIYRQCEDFLALGPVPYASPEMVQADFDHSRLNNGSFCGIFDPNRRQMFGIVDFISSGYKEDPGTAFVSLLMIAAPYRGQGLGAEVVNAVEEWICAGGSIRAIRAGVQVNNPGAIRFWQRLGYVIVSDAEEQPDGTVAFQLYKSVAGWKV